MSDDLQMFVTLKAKAVQAQPTPGQEKGPFYDMYLIKPEAISFMVSCELDGQTWTRVFIGGLCLEIDQDILEISAACAKISTAHIRMVHTMQGLVDHLGKHG